VLELLGNSLDVSDPNGTLEVSARTLNAGEKLVVSYKNKDGLLAPREIAVRKGADNALTETNSSVEGDNLVVSLAANTDSDTVYTVIGGGQTINVTMKKGRADTAGNNN